MRVPVIFYCWFNDHYEIIYYSVAVLPVIIMVINNNEIAGQEVKQGNRLNKHYIFTEYPWTKKCYITCLWALLFISCYAIFSHINILEYAGPFGFRFIPIMMHMLPRYVIRSPKPYIEAGNSNKAFNHDAQ